MSSVFSSISLSVLYPALHFKHRFMNSSIHMTSTGCLRPFFLFLYIFKKLNFNQVQLCLRNWFSKSEHTPDTSLMNTGSAQKHREHSEHQWWCEQNDSSQQVGYSLPDFPGLDTFSTWWLGLAFGADSVGWVDDTHGPRLSFPTVLITLRVTRHYLRHLAKKYMINQKRLGTKKWHRHSYL